LALYKAFFGFWVIACFEDLQPIKKPMPIFFKGLKVGTTGKIKTSHDYKNTYVKLLFNKKLHNLPDNVSANIKKFPDNEQYVDIEMPDKPSEHPLKSAMTIQGNTAPDLTSFLANQVQSNAFADASANMGKVMENTTQITAQLNELMEKINRAIPQEPLSEIVQNIDATAKNLTGLTGSLDDIAKNVDKATKNLDQTFKKLDGTMGETNSAIVDVRETISNVNYITSDLSVITDGVLQTSQKKFGTMRLLFGTPVAQDLQPRTKQGKDGKMDKNMKGDIP
jgi:ABC-type transporter Mla subunit MlaD